jgi:hypothetical protein
LILEDGVERFCRNVGTYATIQGVFDPWRWDWKVFPNTSVTMQQFKERFILEDGTERFSLNVGNYPEI